jgi:hypothetical protein
MRNASFKELLYLSLGIMLRTSADRNLLLGRGRCRVAVSPEFCVIPSTPISEFAGAEMDTAMLRREPPTRSHRHN